MYQLIFFNLFFWKKCDFPLICVTRRKCTQLWKLNFSRFSRPRDSFFLNCSSFGLEFIYRLNPNGGEGNFQIAISLYHIFVQTGEKKYPYSKFSIKRLFPYWCLTIVFDYRSHLFHLGFFHNN